ncbi:MAG: Bro-N domain-containing protein [Methanomassiliicoccaceae archaeon]|nr:Bro-N domain-containing protein [Methanomassiliicoccaceae archaeon]
MSIEEKQVRAVWDEEAEKWWFSIVDIIAILTDQQDALTARKYWNKLKQHLAEEGNQTVTNCYQLKMLAADGKNRLIDAANTEQVLRLIQSIPSKKAEPFKLWLAEVAATDISLARWPNGFNESAEVAQDGAEVAKVARVQIEKSTGKSVISRSNAKKLGQAQLPNKDEGGSE